MSAWRNAASLSMILILGLKAWTPARAEAPSADCYRCKLEMKVSGDMFVNRGGKEVPLSLTATAMHEFTERILATGTDKLPRKSARHYAAAKAVIRIAGDHSERSLRDSRRLLLAQRHSDQIVLFSPVGPLTREELELTDHLDTLTLAALLPDKAATGDTWKLTNAMAQALCGFEGLTSQDITCRLEAAKDGIGVVNVSGTATGIVLGAFVRQQVQAVCRFDLSKRQLLSAEWTQKDQRDAGPVSPAVKMEMVAKLTREAAEPPKELSDLALVVVPEGDEPPAAMLPLLYEDSKRRFTLHYQRDWHLVADTGDHVVFRLMDRGDFVAQAAVAPWKPAKPGEHLAPEEFKAAMARTPGWEPQHELQAGELPLEPGYWGYRLSAQGMLDGIDVVQNFYLIAGPNGEQVVMTFTMTPAQAEKIGTRDLSLVGSVSLPGK